MGIVFGAGLCGNVEFDGPYRLVEFSPPRYSGAYVVMVEDAGWEPYPLQVIYVGESGGLSQRGFPYGHHAWLRWYFAAGCELSRI